METFLRNIFFGNFRRKALSLLAAIVIWLLVSASISTTRTFSRIPVRIVNIPVSKTVKGVLPDGFLEKKISVTLTGNKEVLDRMSSQDFEVRVDASDKGNEWVVHLTKEDLVPQNTDIQFATSIKHVSYAPDLVIHLCNSATEKIPIFVLPPHGDAPEGYQCRAIWPSRLYQTVTGPEEDIKHLQQVGLELSIDMSGIKRDDLDELRAQQAHDGQADDEVSYFIPNLQKEVKIPFLSEGKQTINCPEARQLRIDFLHRDMLALDSVISVRLFYPIKTAEAINPEKIFLRKGGLLKKKGGLFYIDRPLMVSAVSRLFLEIIRENIEIVIIPIIREGVVTFRWHVQPVDSSKLEDDYVIQALSNEFDADCAIGGIKAFRQHLQQREEYLRLQFRDYLNSLSFFISPTARFDLSITSDNQGGVIVKEEEGVA